MQIHSIHVKAWRNKHPLKAKAHSIVNAAIRSGKLIRQPCESCRAPKAQAHHEDYTKPLDIHWLCCKCHHNAHGHYITKPRKRGLSYYNAGGRFLIVDYYRHKMILDGQTRDKWKSYSKHKERITLFAEAGMSFRVIGFFIGISKSTAYKISHNTLYH